MIWRFGPGLLAFGTLGLVLSVYNVSLAAQAHDGLQSYLLKPKPKPKPKIIQLPPIVPPYLGHLKRTTVYDFRRFYDQALVVERVYRFLIPDLYAVTGDEVWLQYVSALKSWSKTAAMKKEAAELIRLVSENDKNHDEILSAYIDLLKAIDPNHSLIPAVEDYKANLNQPNALGKYGKLAKEYKVHIKSAQFKVAANRLDSLYDEAIKDAPEQERILDLYSNFISEYYTAMTSGSAVSASSSSNPVAAAAKSVVSANRVLHQAEALPCPPRQPISKDVSDPAVYPAGNRAHNKKNSNLSLGAGSIPYSKSPVGVIKLNRFAELFDSVGIPRETRNEILSDRKFIASLTTQIQTGDLHTTPLDLMLSLNLTEFKKLINAHGGLYQLRDKLKANPASLLGESSSSASRNSGLAVPGEGLYQTRRELDYSIASMKNKKRWQEGYNRGITDLLLDLYLRDNSEVTHISSDGTQKRPGRASGYAHTQVFTGDRPVEFAREKTQLTQLLSQLVRQPDPIPSRIFMPMAILFEDSPHDSHAITLVVEPSSDKKSAKIAIINTLGSGRAYKTYENELVTAASLAFERYQKISLAENTQSQFDPYSCGIQQVDNILTFVNKPHPIQEIQTNPFPRFTEQMAHASFSRHQAKVSQTFP